MASSFFTTSYIFFAEPFSATGAKGELAKAENSITGNFSVKYLAISYCVFVGLNTTDAGKSLLLYSIQSKLFRIFAANSPIVVGLFTLVPQLNI